MPHAATTKCDTCKAKLSEKSGECRMFHRGLDLCSKCWRVLRDAEQQQLNQMMERFDRATRLTVILGDILRACHDEEFRQTFGDKAADLRYEFLISLFRDER